MYVRSLNRTTPQGKSGSYVNFQELEKVARTGAGTHPHLVRLWRLHVTLQRAHAQGPNESNGRRCEKGTLNKCNDGVFQTTNLNVNSDDYECVFRDNEAA